MQEIRGLDEIVSEMESLPETIKAIGAAVLEDAGRELLGKVQGRIGGSGRVAGAQEYRVGSGKGYVAVRAQSDVMLDGDAAGYVTNALEHGHAQHAGQYVPQIQRRLTRGRVYGKHMYRTAAAQDVPAVAARVANEISAKTAEAIEKGGST